MLFYLTRLEGEILAREINLAYSTLSQIISTKTLLTHSFLRALAKIEWEETDWLATRTEVRLVGSHLNELRATFSRIENYVSSDEHESLDRAMSRLHIHLSDLAMITNEGYTEFSGSTDNKGMFYLEGWQDDE